MYVIHYVSIGWSNILFYCHGVFVVDVMATGNGRMDDTIIYQADARGNLLVKLDRYYTRRTLTDRLVDGKSLTS